MEAPDKIYIYREPPKDYFEDGWGEGKVDYMESIPYIRKDALLESLKRRRRKVEKYQYYDVQRILETYDEVIEKLKKL